MNGLDNDKRLRTNRKMTVDQCLSIDIAQFDCHRDVSFSGELSWLNTHNDERILCVDYLFLPEGHCFPLPFFPCCFQGGEYPRLACQCFPLYHSEFF